MATTFKPFNKKKGRVSKGAANPKSNLFDVVGLKVEKDLASKFARKGAQKCLKNTVDLGRPNPFPVEIGIVNNEYIADKTLLGSESDVVLSYCGDKRYDAVIPGASVPWGTIVIAQDSGDGWLKCGEAYLPKVLENVEVLTLRTFEPVWKKPREPWTGAIIERTFSRDPEQSEMKRMLSSLTDIDTTYNENVTPKKMTVFSFDAFEEVGGSSSGSSFEEDSMELPLECRLPKLESPNWYASGGFHAPHLAVKRFVTDDLQEAAMRGDVALTRRLLSAGVPVNAPIRARCDEEFLTLLHVMACRPAIPNGTRILVEVLRAKANPNVRSSQGSTPLMLACLHKNLGAVEVLLDFGADPTPVDDHLRTAARCAMIPSDDAAESDELCVELADILAGSGTNLDLGGSVSPIVEAVIQHNALAVKALLRLGANPDGLVEAVFNAPLDLINSLIEAQANPFVRDASGKTVMEIALSRGEEPITSSLRDFIGDLERGNHPHLQTRLRLPMGNSLVDMENALMRRGGRGGPRTSVAERLLEQQSQQAQKSLYKRMNAKTQGCCRAILKTWVFQGTMLFGLFLALFLPDVWVCLNLSETTVLDAIIIVLFFAFFVEFALNVYGFRYLYVCKAIFWMDLIGWLSVVLDHSEISILIASSFQGSMESGNMARITKTVKLAARAGRMSKLMKLLRFLPGMSKADTTSGTAAVISKLIHVKLSMQVSSLIILSVIVLPLIEIARFPQADHSLDMWVKLVSVSMHSTHALGHVLDAMVESYEDTDPYPYQVNLIFDNGTSAVFNMFEPPDAVRDVFLVSTGAGQAKILFNFRVPNLNEAISSIALIICVIVAVFSSSYVLNSGVAAIVLNPLEKMLGVVKQVAGNIFNSVDQLSKQAHRKIKRVDEDSEGEKEMNEAKMLDNVLRKLTALSELSVKTTPIDDIENLSEFHVGMLLDYNLQGIFEVYDVKKRSKGRKSLQTVTVNQQIFQPVVSRSHKAIFPQLLSIGMSWNDLTDWDHDVSKVSPDRHESLGILLLQLHAPVSDMSGQNSVTVAAPSIHFEFDSNEGSKPSPKSRQSLKRSSIVSSNVSSIAEGRTPESPRSPNASSIAEGGTQANRNIIGFISAIAAGCSDSPFNNFAHAVDVAASMHKVFTYVHADRYLPDLQRFGLIVAAIAHDVGHPGFTNGFLVRSNHALAIKYNDRACLQNMHCSKLFEIVGKPGSQIFSEIQTEEYKELRSTIIDAIICTELRNNNLLVKEMRLLYDMKSDLFDAAVCQSGNTLHVSSMAIVEYLTARDHLRILRRFFMNFCDVGFATKGWDVCVYWQEQMMEELCLQGEFEASLGMSTIPLYQRDYKERPKAWLVFMDTIVWQLCNVGRNIFPVLSFCEDNLLDNSENWLECWRTRVAPTQVRVSRNSSDCQIDDEFFDDEGYLCAVDRRVSLRMAQCVHRERFGIRSQFDEESSKDDMKESFRKILNRKSTKMAKNGKWSRKTSDQFLFSLPNPLPSIRLSRASAGLAQQSPSPSPSPPSSETKFVRFSVQSPSPT